MFYLRVPSDWQEEEIKVSEDTFVCGLHVHVCVAVCAPWQLLSRVSNPFHFLKSASIRTLWGAKSIYLLVLSAFSPPPSLSLSLLLAHKHTCTNRHTSFFCFFWKFWSAQKRQERTEKGKVPLMRNCGSHSWWPLINVAPSITVLLGSTATPCSLIQLLEVARTLS